MASEKPEGELQLRLLEDFIAVETNDEEHAEPPAMESDSSKDVNVTDSDNNNISDGILGKISKKVDLFFSSDGKTLPRVSMLCNIAYTIPAHILVVIANLIISKMFEDTDYYRNMATFRTKLWIRLSITASIYILSSIYVLGVKKIPSGMMLAVGGVHAFLMNRDIGEFWPAWIIASSWSFGAGCFLFMEGRTASYTRDLCVWALYSNLICLSFPNITGFGGWHDPALLARAALLLSGHALGHPTFKILGFVTASGMVLEFLFPVCRGDGWNHFFKIGRAMGDFFQAMPYRNYNR